MDPVIKEACNILLQSGGEKKINDMIDVVERQLSLGPEYWDGFTLSDLSEDNLQLVLKFLKSFK